MALGRILRAVLGIRDDGKPSSGISKTPGGSGMNRDEKHKRRKEQKRRRKQKQRQR